MTILSFRTSAYVPDVSRYSDSGKDGWGTIAEVFSEYKRGCKLTTQERFLVDGFIEVHRK